MKTCKYNALQILLSLMILLLSLSAGCDSENYYHAQSLNTVKAYEEFLQQYPSSEYSQMAKNNIETLKFKQAKKNSTIEALETYLREYPDGRYNKESKRLIAEAEQKRIDLLKYKQAENTGTPEAFETYLTDNPRGEWVEKAKQKINELAARQASELDPDIKKSYEKTGEQIASIWLELIDKSEWDEAWKLISPRLKKADRDNKDSFSANMKQLRQVGSGSFTMNRSGFFEEVGEKKLIKVTGRKLQSSQYSAKYGNGPVGDYVIILFKMESEHAGAMEHVVVAKDSNDKWCMDGYFIEYKR